MSGELELRSGGALAVDTASVERAAHGFGLVADALEDVGAQLARIGRDLLAADTFDALGPVFQVVTVRQDVAAAVAGARELEQQLRTVAAVYEIVELRAEAAAAASTGDPTALVRAQFALAAAAAESPAAADLAAEAEAAWREGAHAEVGRQAQGAAIMYGPAFAVGPTMLGTTLLTGVALSGAVRGLGRGAIERGERLVPNAEPVAVHALARPDAAPPATLAAAAARIPDSGAARVRVEQYTMSGGTRQFAVYIAGTQSLAGGREAFDMRSNVQLYTGKESASYDAVVAALREAGADDGDVVHAFGHSQGAMIAERLALDGAFDTQTVVTFGSPVAADHDSGTLSVGVRHTDDPVAALAAGGHPGQVGSPGSFIAERVADPAIGLSDLTLDSHHLSAYTETAALLDASTDPRMDEVRGLLRDLGQAASVDATIWEVERQPDLSALGLRADEDAGDPVDE